LRAAARTDRVGGWRLLFNCFQAARQARKWAGEGPFLQRREDPPCLFISACLELARSIPLALADEKNPQDVHKVPGDIGDDCLDALRYCVYSHLEAETSVPVEVRVERIWEEHARDPFSRVMALNKLAAETEDRRYLRRRRAR
jgi:hypothetical protein